MYSQLNLLDSQAEAWLLSLFSLPWARPSASKSIRVAQIRQPSYIRRGVQLLGHLVDAVSNVVSRGGCTGSSFPMILWIGSRLLTCAQLHASFRSD
jgi:hypothetical protein